ncbi:histidine kinase [Algoriphagus yeomjeoni]|uniref:Histidine kinase n=1 Tax=Algoriphagus yeomjeoni TaxID=291403 RepID=A0A327PIK7_9BACT|nr:histidine kinase [Algoriphagus yeomjeoni]
MFVIKIGLFVIFVFWKTGFGYFRRMFPKASILKALGWGLGVTLLITVLLQQLGFIRIDPEEYLENILILGSWWILVSLVFYYGKKVRFRSKSLLHILYLALFFTVILLLDQWMAFPDNPVSIGLLILFWIGVAWFVAPAFFKKYQKLIFIVYALIWLLFVYMRYTESYFQEHRELVIFMLLLPIPFFLLLWIFEQWKKIKDLENQKNQAELAMLKNQINPHFLFNTLNNLYGLCVEKSDAAPEVVLRLSDMMRYTIYEGSERTVLLGKEVGYLENFLGLQKLRHRYAPEIDFQVTIQEDQMISPLMLIVPVENAFKHGVEKLTEQAFVRILVDSNQERLRFTVENNFDPNTQSHNPGIGLENLKRRLELAYPDSHFLQITKNKDVHQVILEILWS